MRRVLAAVALLAVAVGCGKLPPVSVHPDDRSPERILPLWQVKLDEHPVLAFFPKEFASPAYANDGKLVIAGSDAGVLVGVNAKTGAVKWRFKTDGKIRSAPVVQGIYAYLGAMDGKLYKLDARYGVAAGQQWPFETRGAITSRPTVDEDRVYFRNNENRLYAVDRKTGRYVWEATRPRVDELTITGEASPLSAHGLVFSGFDDGVLLALSPETGATVWSKSLAGTETKFVDVDTSPITMGETVYAGSFASGLYALAAKSGAVSWWFKRRGVKSPAHDGTYLYVSTIDGELSALDPLTGQPVWTTLFPEAELSEPSLADDKVIVGTGKSVAVVDAATGRVLGRVGSDDGQAATAVSERGLLHYVTNAGALVGARLQ